MGVEPFLGHSLAKLGTFLGSNGFHQAIDGWKSSRVRSQGNCRSKEATKSN